MAVGDFAGGSAGHLHEQLLAAWLTGDAWQTDR